MTAREPTAGIQILRNHEEIPQTQRTTRSSSQASNPASDVSFASSEPSESPYEAATRNSPLLLTERKEPKTHVSEARWARIEYRKKKEVLLSVVHHKMGRKLIEWS